MLHSGFHGTANRVRALFWFPAQKSCHCAPEQPFYGWVTVLLHTNNLHLNVAAIHNIKSNVQLTTAVDIWQTKRKKKREKSRGQGSAVSLEHPCMALAVPCSGCEAAPQGCCAKALPLCWMRPPESLCKSSCWHTVPVLYQCLSASIRGWVWGWACCGCLDHFATYHAGCMVPSCLEKILNTKSSCIFQQN